MQNYKIGNFMSKLICYIPINVDGFLLETLLKNKLKSHLTKLKTETICYMNLKTLKKEILETMNFMSNHICNCLLCKKSYNFVAISSHLCNKKNEFINFDIVKNQSKNPTKKISKKSTKKISKNPTKKISKKSTKNLSKNPTKKISKNPTKKISKNPTKKISKNYRK
jgi:hypothetical protein